MNSPPSQKILSIYIKTLKFNRNLTNNKKINILFKNLSQKLMIFKVSHIFKGEVYLFWIYFVIICKFEQF